MIKLNNVEKDVKRFIKRKVSVTLATMVVFLMTGAFLSANTVTVEERINSVEARMTSVEERVKSIENKKSSTVVDGYTKAEADGKFATKDELATKVNIENVYSKEDADGIFVTETALTDGLDTKLDKTKFEEFTTGLKKAIDGTLNTIKSLGDGMEELANTKLDKTEFTEDKVTEKVKKGSLTSSSLTVGGTGKVVEADITVELKDETKSEIAKIEGKLDKTEFVEKSAKIQEELDANKQAITEEKTIREGAITALNERVIAEETARAEAIKAETTAREAADEEIKIEVAKKADKTALETETTERKADDLKLLKTIGALADANNEEVQTIKQAITDEKTAREEMDTKLKAAHDDLVNTIDKFNKEQVVFNDTVDQSLDIIDDSLAEIDEKIAEKANSANVYTKTEVDNTFATKIDINNVKTDINDINTKLNNFDLDTRKTEIETLKTDVDELKMLGGTQDGLAKIEELKKVVEEEKTLRETAIGEAVKDIRTEYTVADTELTKAINDVTDVVRSTTEVLMEADQGLKNEIDTKANAEDVYTKTESDARFVKIEGTVEEQGGTITTHTKRIEVLEKVAVNHETRIDNLEVKTDKLEKRIDSVASITAAMTTLDLGSVPVGQLGIGISFGASGKSQAVAAGLGFAPTENFKLNAKFSTSTGKERRTAVGAGAVYYLNLK